MLIYWYLVILAFILIVVAVCFFLMRRYYIRLLRYEVVRARRSEHIKTVFLANVSHALRNPLHSIINTCDEALSIGVEDMKPRQISDAFTQINKDGTQLMYFISQLIELSNIESNVMTFTLIEVNLAELMQSYRREAQRDAADGVSVVVRSRLSPTTSTSARACVSPSPIPARACRPRARPLPPVCSMTTSRSICSARAQVWASVSARPLSMV